MSVLKNISWPSLFGGETESKTDTEKKTGAQGEDIAVSFLKKHGYTVLVRNYRRRFGEVDIIAEENDTLVFVEVKTRKNDRFGNPFESVDIHKQRKLSKMALDYICRNKLEDQAARFDVLVVRLNSSSTPKVELIRNAFDFQE